MYHLIKHIIGSFISPKCYIRQYEIRSEMLIMVDLDFERLVFLVYLGPNTNNYSLLNVVWEHIKYLLTIQIESSEIKDTFGMKESKSV